ncbi:MAG: hypothetical protein LBK25_01880 [Treponema sp.]|jgi:hypothetical protein|nr:hypothetical protein [Treponema sp.]
MSDIDKYGTGDMLALLKQQKQALTDQETTKQLARSAYAIIRDTAGSNSFIQALTGFAGFPFNLIVDGVVLFTHYGAMINKIRLVYNQDPVTQDEMSAVIKQISKEILFDIIIDKALGSIPIIGIYPNMICAKYMTWRVGILFTMLSSRGGDISKVDAEKTIKLIRMVFPQSEALKFTTPDYKSYEKLVISVTGASIPDFDEKVNKALSAMM